MFTKSGKITEMSVINWKTENWQICVNGQAPGGGTHVRQWSIIAEYANVGL